MRNKLCGSIIGTHAMQLRSGGQNTDSEMKIDSEN
jgi:hypothetical protein